MNVRSEQKGECGHRIWSQIDRFEMARYVMGLEAIGIRLVAKNTTDLECPSIFCRDLS